MKYKTMCQMCRATNGFVKKPTKSEKSKLIKARDKEMENRFSTEEKLSCKYAIYKKGGYMAVGVYPSLEIAERELARKNKQYKIFEIRKIESW